MSTISKELLSEVIGIDVAKILKDEYSNNISIYERNFQYPITYNASAYLIINIYELAHKCKEWAYEKYKYTIIEWAGGVDIIDAEEREIETFLNLDNPLVLFNVKFTLKACQWILDNKEK